ncbi:hypothetical protein F67_I3_11_016 [Rhizobium phage RHph_I3_11]|nr:hypothetical protein F67_I3_11_016 [Rhizobium phage RHph_I3_11]
MTISELIKALEALNEPDLPVIVMGGDSERFFLKPEWIRILDDDYSHADKDGVYTLIGRALEL